MATLPAAGTAPAVAKTHGSALVVPGNDPFAPLLAQALACADAALEPQVGRAVLSPGGPVAWDDCCDGQVWVRLISLVPSALPANAGRNAAPCGVMQWTATLGVGVLRCVASLDDAGNAPTPAQLSVDTRQMTADVADLSAALQCCLAPHVNRLIMLRWDPLGPQGGCAGGEWQVQVLVDNCRCP
jgi:hypothetical protein